MEAELPPAAQTPPGEGGPRRAQARVGLVLLKALRDRDRPPELLDDENVTDTLPRRFGLSGVVNAQIQRYEDDARRRRRISEEELRGLIRLVTRRPDAGDVFRAVGRSLAGTGKPPGWRKVLPDGVLLLTARRRIARHLRSLFGIPMVETTGDPFAVVGLTDTLIEADPGGDACAVVSGLCQAILEAYGQGARQLEHSDCRARGGDRCEWTLTEP